MRRSILPASLVFACVLTAAAVCRANVNFPFNASAEDWTFGTIPPASGTATPAWDWYPAPSSYAGALQARLTASGSAAGAWAMSPCLEVVQNSQQEYIHVDIEHFTLFPAGILGQVQFRFDLTGTSGWGSWQGIPGGYWFTTNHVPPTEANVFPPLLTSSTVPPNDWLAFSGTNNASTDPDASAPGSGPHVRSAFDLPWAPYGIANGSEIQFRFLIGVNDVVPTQSETILWEVNQVQIDGVKVCAVPEPSALALAGIGCLVLIGAARRIRRRFAGSTAAAAVFVVIALGCALAVTPAKADATWDFLLSNGNWTSEGNGFLTNGNRWKWSGTTALPLTGGTSPHWHVRSQGMTPGTQSAALLTSPVFSGLVGPTPAQNARISISHDFLFALGTNGLPITTGQLQYQLNGSGTWVGLPLAAFTTGSVSGTNVVFGPSPLAPYVDQDTFVVPTYLTPSGTALKHAAPNSAAFVQGSPGWPTAYVPTEAFLNANTGLPAAGISTLQLRFANLNIGSNCDNNEGWNVRFVQVDFDTAIPPVPEPGALAIGATGLAGLMATGILRGRYQRPSRPSDRP